jgi:hypothetical protein
MALYHLDVQTFGRARGGRVTRSAAYRAGERIRDERTREVYTYDREDVVYKEIVLSAQFAATREMDWARDRSALWNAAEDTDRCNARLAREVLVVLPPELTPMQRTHLVRRYAQELADRYQNAVDATIHLPRPYADERHHHAHLLMTVRQVTREGLGARISCELSAPERHARGLGPYRADFMWVRERWAQVTNEALRNAGLSIRIDHRSLKARGIDREPIPRIPRRIFYMERRNGIPSQAGNDIRRSYRERVEARLKGVDELARVLQRQKREARERAIERAKQKEGLPKKIAWSALTREELLQRRRDYYQANREILKEKQRAYYRENAEVIKQKARDARQQAKPTPEQQAAQRWLKLRARQQAQDEKERQRRVKRGLPPPALTAEDDARNWWASREREKQAELSQSAERRHSHEHAFGKSADDDDDDRQKRRRDRSRDYDYEL